MNDRQVLFELLGSVYLTARQKQALAALLRDSSAPREGHSPNWRQVDVIASGTELEEEERHALLGPCGAE